MVISASTDTTHHPSDKTPAGHCALAIVGAGPAGLSAAVESVKLGVTPTVFEKAPIVGGIARTEVYDGCRFDMGGHRFFTKVREIQDFWRELLPDDFLKRPRLSRIYYKKKYFYYPLRPMNALGGLGVLEAVAILTSYCRAKFFPSPREDTFAQWVSNRFGSRLFNTFFKSYTEKVWGISTSELSADWAAQRIKNLSLKSALLSTIVKPRRKITSLIEEFDYPRLGPGMMWEAASERVGVEGGAVHMRAEVVKLEHENARISHVTVADEDGKKRFAVDEVISSMPITETIARLDPPAPAPVREAASKLAYRDFLTVGLIIDRTELFPDNWIYVHDPDVKVGRIQNFKNWSPEMIRDPEQTTLGLEYFCNEGDAFWIQNDDTLVDLAMREIEILGLAKRSEIRGGCVFRVPKAYPVYDQNYKTCLETLRHYLSDFQNFQTIGRNGLHRYNNQDHAMLTGLYAVRNVILGERNDLWSVNVDEGYHEEIDTDDGDQESTRVQPTRSGRGRLVPAVADRST